MSPPLTTFLFEAANFLVLAGVLTWLLFRPVRSAIEKRRESIAREHQQAAEKLADADRMRAEIAERLNQLDEELRAQRETAKKEAGEEAERIVAETREAAERERAALKRQMAYLEHARVERLSNIIAATTGQAVGRLLQDIADSDLDEALLKEGRSRLASFNGKKIAPVIVESARKLTDEERINLQNALKEAGQTIEFRVAEELKVGLRISTNQGLIDLSGAGLAEFAERSLSAQLKQFGEEPERDGST